MGKTVIFDTGHGGVINGVYQTAGKRSPKWSKGTLYEGMFNRWVVNRLIEKLDRNSIPYYHVSPEFTDTSLTTRVQRISRIYEKNTKVFVLSIHANAGGGRGIEGFTTRGNTDSDRIGEIILGNLETDLKDQRMRFDRTDGDRDKESNYYILRKVEPSAFLLEAGFMDNQFDYYNLWDEAYLTNLVDSLFKSIKQIYEN